MKENLLLPFYFGSINDDQRLEIERRLLTDEAALLDYLDLKREIEAAKMIVGPSPGLWARLKSKVPRHKRRIYSLSVGAAIAASLLLAWHFLASAPRQEVKTGTQILFDSNSELSINSGVL